MGIFDGIETEHLRDVYNELWAERISPEKIVKTYWKHGDKSKDSENSFQLNFADQNIDRMNITKADKNKIYLGLNSFFKPLATDFERKYQDVCFASGNEYKEIMKLHSSSLCALLMFSSVSDDNPLMLELNVRGVKANFKFTKVLFEYENKVINPNHPSSVDVVLVGENLITNKKAILFLESKFSEYLTITNQFKRLGAGYLDKPYCDEYYNDGFLKDLDIRFLRNTDNTLSVFSHEDKDGKKTSSYGFETISGKQTYLEGLKQLISHYIGITNFIRGNIVDKRKDALTPDGAEIYLGEILFDFKFEDAQNKLMTYTSYYQRLSKKLNNLRPNIHVLDDVLKYSLFKKENSNYLISDEIRKFYRLD